MGRLREELEFGKRNGAVGVYMHGIEHDTPLCSSRFDPLYAMAEDLDLPICFHAGNNMYVACQVTDDLDCVLKYAGETQLVLGTDYGHADTATEIEAMRKLGAEGKVPEATAARILEDAARALYGL